MDVDDINVPTVRASRAARTGAKRQQDPKLSAKTGSNIEVANSPDVDDIRRRRAAYFDTPDFPGARGKRPARSKPAPDIQSHPDFSKSHVQEEKGHRTRSSHGSSGKVHVATKAQNTNTDRVYATSTRRVMQGESQTKQVKDTRSKEHGRVRRKSRPATVTAVTTAEDDAKIQGKLTKPLDHIEDERRQQRRVVRAARHEYSAMTPMDSSSSRSQAEPLIPTSIVLHEELSVNDNHTASRLQVSRPGLRGIKSFFGPRYNTLAEKKKKKLKLAAAKTPRLTTCLTCGADDIVAKTTAKLSCGHRMCHDCLKRIFKLSVKDPAHMPPRCCGEDHIPLSHVKDLFDVALKMRWNRKYQEYHTKNRIYCPKPECGKWIKPAHIRSKQGRQYARCPYCTTKVCVTCNHIMHKSRDCPKDPGIARLVEQMAENGWQRCYSCDAMIELTEGCNHMKCRCTAEFCMVCGSKWKTCDCPWFSAARAGVQDQLNEMRVPNPVPADRNVPRNVIRLGQGLLAREGNANLPRRQTYQNEMDQRRRQVRDDAELARRLQMASLLGRDNDPTRDGLLATGIWGIGNAGEHFMNDNFIPIRTDVVMPGFDDSQFGRRGEGTSGGRQRARQTRGVPHSGLLPNFLGDESVIGSGGRA